MLIFFLFLKKPKLSKFPGPLWSVWTSWAASYQLVFFLTLGFCAKSISLPSPANLFLWEMLLGISAPMLVSPGSQGKYRIMSLSRASRKALQKDPQKSLMALLLKLKCAKNECSYFSEKRKYFFLFLSLQNEVRDATFKMCFMYKIQKMVAGLETVQQ